MSNTQAKMLQWLDDTGTAMTTPGTLVIAEATGETFDAHSADTDKHLSAAEKAALKNAKPVQIVTDIAARDALSDPFVGLSAYVKDATGDSSVSKGGAYYIYDGTAWMKTAEAESMDVVLPITESEMIDINTKKHTHANADSLAKLAVDADGLKVDGVCVGGIAIVSNAEEVPVYNGKLRLVITEYTPPVQP